MKIPKPKILIYDIETTLSMFQGFRLGKTVLRHNQLLKGYFSRTRIICVTYRWAHERKSKIITWGDSEKDEKKMIIEFDKLVNEADIVIGKNSDSFDNKHMNTHRMWNDLPGMPEWTKHTDDLERQMRRHFNLMSFSLDYFSEQLGLGGKDKMEFADWEAINLYRIVQVQGITTREGAAAIEMISGKSFSKIKREGKVALKKMFKYGLKDTDDTLAIWNYAVKHFEPKYNAATALYKTHGLVCKLPGCGSANLTKNGTRIGGQTIYQHFRCNDHHGYAGKASINQKTGKLGKMS